MRKYEIALREAKRLDANFKNVITLLRSSIYDGDHRAEYALATWLLHGRHVAKISLKRSSS